MSGRGGRFGSRLGTRLAASTFWAGLCVGVIGASCASWTLSPGPSAAAERSTCRQWKVRFYDSTDSVKLAEGEEPFGFAFAPQSGRSALAARICVK